MKRRRHERLVPACSNNGKLVHLVSRATHRAACGFRMGDINPVQGRITCRGCTARRPITAIRHANKPLVIGLNWEPFYRACERALVAGDTELPNPRVKYWPRLA